MPWPLLCQRGFSHGIHTSHNMRPYNDGGCMSQQYNREIQLLLQSEADLIRRGNAAKSEFTQMRYFKAARKDRERINILFYGANKQGKL